MNFSNVTHTTFDTNSVQQTIRILNFILSCTGLGFNLLLLIILVSIGRRHCTTYFLLILMTICDFLYCALYVSISLTVDQYLNIINHEVICPLSFFLTPFGFTGSALLLFICLLHLATNYVRKYDTMLGQISGRLSVIFVLSFIIIRSVLSTTSVELVALNPKMPHIKDCIIDMNPPELVKIFQKLNHVFSEVTDILIYIGWIIILLIYLIQYLPCGKFASCERHATNLLPVDKPHSFTSLVTLDTMNNKVPNETTTIELFTTGSPVQEEPTICSKQKHNDVSSIIISIGFLSVVLYLPIIISKYSVMYIAYTEQTFLNDSQTQILQIIQQTTLLFCLSIRFLPYFIFDRRIRLLFSQMFGMKCMKMDKRKARLRQGRYKLRAKYRFHCQCYRRQEILGFHPSNNPSEN